MNESNRFPFLIPLTALAFAAAHLTFEHFTGGVRSHHLFNQANLPAISNWFGLVILPVLGIVFGKRVQTYSTKKCWNGIPVNMIVPFLSAIIYGVTMAVTFLYGATNISSIAFLGLFVSGFVFPVYRIEYILGFVAGMTIFVGSVLPFLFALIVAVVSFIVRYFVRKFAGIFRKKQNR